MNPTAKPPAKPPEIFVKSKNWLALIGLIAILFVIVRYAILPYAPTVMDAFQTTATVADAHFTKKNQLRLDAPAYTLTSGQTVPISWTRDNIDGDGSYTIYYACQNGVFVEYIERGITTLLYCNETRHILAENNTVLIIPHFVSIERPQTELRVILSFIPNTESAQAQTTPTSRTTASFLVNTKSGEVRPSNVAPTGTGSGTIDLTGRILETGVINRTTNAFTPTAEIGRTERGGVRFEVKNVGTQVSKAWNYAVVLPTYPPYTFYGAAQQPLYPGDRVELIVAFDNIYDADTGSLIINIDPAGSAKNERATENNILRGSIKIRK